MGFESDTNYSTFDIRGGVVNFQYNDKFRRENITDNGRYIMVANCVVNIPLALASIIGNALVLHAVWKTPSLRSPSLLLLCGLALSDLAVGAVVQPLFVADNFLRLYAQSQKLKELFHSGYSTVGFSLCGVSLCTMAGISIDRFIAIQKPLRYASIVTLPRIKRILVAIWGICLFLASAQLWEERVLLVSIIFMICICLCISIICHVSIYKIVRRHQIEIQTQLQAVESNTANINMASLHKSAFNAFIVFIVLVICYCPYLVVYVVSVSVSSINHKILGRAIASTVVFINSALNPLLYCWRLRELRDVVLQTFYKIVY